MQSCWLGGRLLAGWLVDKAIIQGLSVKILSFFLLISISCASFAGLNSISAVILPGSLQDYYGSPENESALSPQQALHALEAYAIGQGAEKEGSALVLLASTTSKYTDFGDYKSYAVAVKFDAPMSAQKIRLNSYMVKPEKGKKYIVYPIATAFDEHHTLLKTLVPTNESDIKGNTISNILDMPEGTKYLLLHTNPAYVTIDMATGKRLSEDKITIGVAALGGVVGGLFHGVLFNSQVKRGKVGIAPVGMVEVVQFKP